MRNIKRITREWIWFLLVATIMFLLIGFDPIGDFIVRHPGKGADDTITNIVFLGAVIYVIFFQKPRGKEPG